jgi:hypothetical protein
MARTHYERLSATDARFLEFDQGETTSSTRVFEDA